MRVVDIYRFRIAQDKAKVLFQYYKSLNVEVWGYKQTFGYTIECSNSNVQLFILNVQLRQKLKILPLIKP